MKCLRVQLSKEEWDERRDEKPAPLCAVCGYGSCADQRSLKLRLLQLSCSGTMSCSRCRSTQYCSKFHQKLEWSTHKLSCGQHIAITAPGTASDSPRPASANVLYPGSSLQLHADISLITLYAEYDMVVEAEVVGDELVQGDESAEVLRAAMGTIASPI